MSNIPNVLAQRYASHDITSIWSEEGKIVLEREFWIAVMKAQKELGLDIPEEAISAYESVKGKVDTKSIAERERVTRHDVKARIEEFCDLAGYEHIHKGMTSRDLTENVEQLQVFLSLNLIIEKSVSALIAIGEQAKKHSDIQLTARTHNVAAQATTLGKRFAMYGEELEKALRSTQFILSEYTVRGLKGAVGTQMDTLTLFDGDEDKVAELEAGILKHLGLPYAANAVGQVYPRSYDFEVISSLFQLASPMASFAKTLRVMAGHELASEGFAKGQVGSSAMPHKMNSRTCERINGLQVILGGYLNMASNLSGDQWNEGDVSCSVVRRLMLPDSFFAIDGLLESFLTIMQQFEIYPSVIEKENNYYLPFLLTTTILMEAVKNGGGREEVHKAIKEHAIATVRDLRNGEINENDLLEKLANDKRVGLNADKLAEILKEKGSSSGLAKPQTTKFCLSVEEWKQKFPKAGDYKPGKIL